MQRHAGAIWLPRANEGVFATLFQGNGYGYGPKGVYLPSAMQRQAMWQPASRPARRHGQARHARRRLHAAGLRRAATTRGAEILSRGCSPPPTIASDGSRRAGRADDSVRRLVIPRRAPGRAAVIATAYGMTTNTSPFNVTGHPSISIPCGWIDGLPGRV